jgi:cytochrome c biogenesis protein CcmG, thiol:disulfide interchange protein DsbE
MRLLRTTMLCSILFACAGVAAQSQAASNPLLDLSPHKGKVVYVDFWASWCVPCRESFPWMQAMQAKYAAKGLVIVSVNVDEVRADAERFLAKYGRGITVQYDSTGTVAKDYDLKGMPSSFIVDRAGNVKFKHTGFREKDRDAFESEIRQMVAE